MKKILYIAVLLAAFTTAAAAPLYFGTQSGYNTYNSYKWWQIEIKEFRGQSEKPVADWIKKAGYPLIKEGGPNGEKNPYVEVDTNGHKVHKYRRYTYEPRKFTKLEKDSNGSMSKEWLDSNNDGIYEAPPSKKKPEGKPIVVKNGLHKGKKLDQLVVVYEKLPGKSRWICYDAYWVWSTRVTRRAVQRQLSYGFGFEPGMQNLRPMSNGFLGRQSGFGQPRGTSGGLGP